MLPKNFLAVVTAILLMANFYIIIGYDLEISRWARLLTTTMFLLILVMKRLYSKKMLAAFLFLLISDFGLFEYENHLANAGTFLMRISAYILLVFVVVPELKKLKANLFQKITFMLVFSLNLAMLQMLVGMVPVRFVYPGLNILFYIYGFSMIAMVIASISYSNRYSDKTSFFYTSATLCLVFSDITSFIAYYLNFDEFYFPDRIFYILGLSGLVKFAGFARSHKAVAELQRL